MKNISKIFVDIGPLAVFFIFYTRGNLQSAILPFMIATVIAVLFSYIVDKKIVRINSKQGLEMMGFPKTFKIPVSENQAMKQLGNSVAVNVVKAIGEEINYHLNNYSK